MPTYTYKARDATGKLVKGVMEAATQDELTHRLEKLGYMTTQARETSPAIKIQSIFDRFTRVRTEDMVMFNVQLSNLIHAGISLLVSLETLGKQVENKRLRETIERVSREMEAGASFSEALAHHPKVFPKLFVDMVKAGEASGKLDTILIRFATYYEEQADLKQKITAALFYPLILLAAGLLVSVFIVTFVIPQFAEVFTKTGIQLPLPTLILYHLGITLKQFWYSIILFGIVGWLAIGYYAGTQAGRFHVDRLNLAWPVLGTLHRKVAISRFTRTLGMLVASGVPILDALDIVRDVVGNEVLGRVVRTVRAAVEKGEKMSEPLKISGEFPPDTVRMIAVGEETGELDKMLDKIADFYDRSVGYTVKKLTTILEPLLLVIMGGLVGFIMASMLLPMFDMMKILRQGRASF